MTFSPSETALLYTAEANAPKNTPDDPYAKFRYKPSLGEGFGGKKRPHFFLLRWRTPTDPDLSTLKPTLYEIHPETDGTLFGQGIFFPNSEENIIYATGYEYTPNGRLLGVKGCFNRPFGIWELRLQKQIDNDGNDEKKHDLTIDSARKISGQNSSRSPRIVKEGSKIILCWLSSDAGGPHVSTTSLQSLEITSPDSISPDNASKIRTVVPIPNVKEAEFPGLYPPFNLPSLPFLYQDDSVEVITQSQWGSRNTILSISLANGTVKNLTPPEPGQSD